MAKLVKTDPKDLLNLQRGEFAHFVEDGIAINDVKTYEPRHRKSRINEHSDTKKFRLVLNVIFTVAIFAGAILTGFYPLSLLMFLALYDLRSIQRTNLPLNKSKFLPYKNIVEARLVKGRLGLNYAHLTIKDDNGVLSLKKLKLYDSDSTWERARVLFNRIGVLKEEIKEEKDLSKLEKVTIGNGVEYALEDDQLLLIENGKFKESREDAFKYFRWVALVGLALCIGAAIAKVYNIITLHQYHMMDYVGVLFFLLVAIVPFRLIRKANPTFVKKSDIVSIEEKSKEVILTIKGWKGFPLLIKLSKKYISKEGINKLITFSK